MPRIMLLGFTSFQDPGPWADCSLGPAGWRHCCCFWRLFSSCDHPQPRILDQGLTGIEPTSTTATGVTVTSLASFLREKEEVCLSLVAFQALPTAGPLHANSGITMQSVSTALSKPRVHTAANSSTAHSDSEVTRSYWERAHGLLKYSIMRGHVGK